MQPLSCKCRTALFLLAILPACLQGLLTFPNIEYLGSGYDIVKANPQPLVTDPSPFDPGWTGRSVVDMTTFKNNYTYDNKWLRPDSADILQTGACQYATQRSEVGSAASYQKSLSADIHVSGSYNAFLLKASFSASVDYSKTASATQSEQQFYFSSVAKCEMYRASLVAYETLPLGNEFRDGVASLPTELNSSTVDAVTTFVGYFGTHYTSEIKMGGKASYIAVFDKASYNQMSAGGVDVNAAASLSYAAWTGSANVQNDSHYKDYQAYSSSKSSFQHSCVGANGQCPPESSKQDSNDWSEAVSELPVPIEYTLSSIDTLLTPQYFPSDSDILARQRVLYEFLTGSAGGLGYCGRVEKCDPPDPAGYWVDAASMQVARRGFAMAALGGKLYAAGGDEAEGQVESYDPSSNSWTYVASMLATRQDFAMAALDGKLYAAGGQDEDMIVWFDSVESYDPDSDSWTSLDTSMQSVRRVFFAMAALDGKLYAAGGRTNKNDFSCVSSVESYDPSSDSWTYVESMLGPRCGDASYTGFAMVALDGKLYAAGGDGGAAGGASVESYDPSSDSWTLLESMPGSRSSFAMVALGGKLYAAGGGTDSVESYDPSSNSWTSVVDMQVSRNNFAMAALGEKVYAAGGNYDFEYSMECFWNVSANMPQLERGMVPKII